MKLIIMILFFSWTVANARGEENVSSLGFVASEISKLETLQKQYQAIAQNNALEAWIIAEKINPGDQDDRIPDLRAILASTGEYKGNPQNDPQRYDNELVEAVKKFQLHHALNADGIIGKQMQLALAVPAEKRLQQIKATLARLAKIHKPFEEKFIFINLPAYNLYLMENSKAMLEMRIIIGTKENPTPVFDSNVTDIVFNPSWHVPKSIAYNELTPKLRENPDYFTKNEFVITDAEGEEVDPATANASGEALTFRQRAGDKNALGKIKFNLEKSDSIYIHSTANPGLFTKEYRALSHGCMRAEKPRELAYFILQGNPDWEKGKIDAAYNSTNQRTVSVRKLPVHVVYWTVFVDNTMEAYFYSDVYDKAF